MSMQNPNDRRRVAVVGGGAAGLLAAAVCGERGADVTLYERNEKVGRKLAITGKGRCNLTNACEPDEFLRNVVSNPRFLNSSLYGFTPADTQALFETLGVPLKVERGRRVFPLSDKSYDIVDALWTYAKKHAVLRHEKVTGLLLGEGGDFPRTVCGVRTEKREERYDAVILCTGGISYPVTGSDGSGHRFAREAGHTVTELSPSLVPLTSSDPVCPALMGLSLKNVALRVVERGSEKTIYEDFGEMLFTHFGLSGPMILSASSHIHTVPVSSCDILIDLKPALDEKTLDERILSDFSKEKNRCFENSLGALLPAKMAAVIPQRTGIDPRKKVNEITKEERRRLLSVIKAFRVSLSGTRPIAEAIITRGGVNVGEVDPRTMASKRCRGLYFAGELLDVDAYTGGYNLQIAFSTAVAAGTAAALGEGAKAPKEKKAPKKGKDKKIKNDLNRKGDKNMKIAIDGPSGAGKSTLAKRVAKELGIIYVDTGALYRTVGLWVNRHGVAAEDTAGIKNALDGIKVELGFDEKGTQRVYLCGEDVSDLIRTPLISKYASAVSAVPEVRALLFGMQREIAEKNSVVMDGRDIGTVILPDADVKIFLCASDLARARRRAAELREKGEECTVEEILAAMRERDTRDSTREIAPAVAAPDAIILDNSDLDLEGTVKEALRIIREATGGDKK